MMKKYIIPEIEIKEFENESIIASNTGQSSETGQSELHREGISLGSVDYNLW